MVMPRVVKILVMNATTKQYCSALSRILDLEDLLAPEILKGVFDDDSYELRISSVMATSRCGLRLPNKGSVQCV